ncbi:DUF4365 domain-containing protein [Bacillus cereus]|uniref:DUF4365 domain-containing protein n=1 Tax=Bacillus cereus TaxID=1396 RepID=UPI0024BF0569|nr:DUF4365 domain-containing protein [Bacillus cereus]
MFNNIGNIAVQAVGKLMAEMNVHQQVYTRDVGVDALYEIFEKQYSKGYFFVGQIKGGDSYSKKGDCYYYDEEREHINTWLQYSLPVFLFIYESNFYNEKAEKRIETCYWIDALNFYCNNPQPGGKGYTFRFNKKGNELKLTTRDEFIDIVKIRAGNQGDPYKVARYYYNLFKELCIHHKGELDRITVNSGQEVADWLGRKGFKEEYKKHNLFQLAHQIITDYVIGFGIIGGLLRQRNVHKINMKEQNIWIHYDLNKVIKIEKNDDYDIKKIKKFLSNYVVESRASYDICVYNGSEILVDKSAESIQIFSKPYSLEYTHQYIEKKMITPECIEVLSNIVNEKLNTIIIGSKNTEKHLFISLMASFFEYSDKIYAIEDRKQVTLNSGKEIHVNYCHSNDTSNIIKNINQLRHNYYDRIIFNCGNFSLDRDRITEEILEVYKKNKGCIAVYNMVTECIKEIPENLNDVLKSSKDISSIILLEESNGDIKEIWNKRYGAFKKVYPQ